MAKRFPSRKSSIAPTPALAVAALVGVVLGFLGARGTSGPPATPPPEVAEHEGDRTQLDLPIGYARERHLPVNVLGGLTEAQKYSALKAISEVSCDCGTPGGTYGSCLTGGMPCPGS